MRRRSVRRSFPSANHPPGRVYHACFGTAESVFVFDVWSSQAAFNKFGETLMPIMTALGLSPGQPMVADVRNVIIPPAKRAKPAARKARKRAAARKANTRGRRSRRR
jgi:hypothetical protein